MYFSTEMNSVTDNPTVFPQQDLIISAGNFHGQPLALAMDFAIAMAELGSISERRTYQLIAGLRELPPFLVANPGLDSGFMIPQYTAASIVSQNKQLCTPPASVDSIVSFNGQEDHVSMGANAATKLRKVVLNIEKVLAIELMNASQAMEFRRPLRTSDNLELLLKDFRKVVPFVRKDRVLYKDIEAACSSCRNYSFDKL